MTSPCRELLFQAGERHPKLPRSPGRIAEQAYRRLTSHWHTPDGVLPQRTEPATLLSDVSHWPATGGFIERMMMLDSVTTCPETFW